MLSGDYVNDGDVNLNSSSGPALGEATIVSGLLLQAFVAENAVLHCAHFNAI